MSIATVPERTTAPEALQNRQRLAWGVMLIAFSVFCTLAALTVIGVHYFVFQSTIPIQAQVQVSRGTAILIGSDLFENGVRDTRDVGTSSVVTTDAQSQAEVTFRDRYADNALIASITLKNGASFGARQFVRPRFDWSVEPYWIHITNIQGEFDIEIPSSVTRATVMTVDISPETSIRLNSAGRYTISSTSSQMRVVNYSGDALVIFADHGTYPIPIAQQGYVTYSDNSEFKYAPAYANLLGETGFSSLNVIDFAAAPDSASQSVWRCNNFQNSAPEGHFEVVGEDGYPALRLYRGENAESHGETNCAQTFSAAGGLDISRYNYLAVRATFKIMPHTLSACGGEGSECPLMLRMDYYAPSQPDPIWWIHGFYASFNPGIEYPFTCDTCNDRHEIINPDRWYTYESGNLLTSLPQERRPSALLNMRFYASGHQYDVYISEIELLVDQAVVLNS